MCIHFAAPLSLSLSHSLSFSLSVARRREYLITFYKHNWRALQSMLHLFSCTAAAAAAATHVRHINNAVIISALRTHTNTTAQTISLLVFHTEKNKGQHDWAHTHTHTLSYILHSICCSANLPHTLAHFLWLRWPRPMPTDNNDAGNDN